MRIMYTTFRYIAYSHHIWDEGSNWSYPTSYMASHIFSVCSAVGVVLWRMDFNIFQWTREKAWDSSWFSCVPRLERHAHRRISTKEQSLACPSVPSCKPLDRIDAVSHDQQTPLQTHVAFPWAGWKENPNWTCLSNLQNGMTWHAEIVLNAYADFPQGPNMFQLSLRIHLLRSPLQNDRRIRLQSRFFVNATSSVEPQGTLRLPS